MSFSLQERYINLQDPIFLELFEVAELANFTRPEQERYERSLKYYRDLNNVIDTSKEEGIEIGKEQGIEIGKEQGIEIGKEQGIEIGKEQGIEQGIEIGKEQGIEQGIELGKQQEARSLLVKLLAYKFGTLPESLSNQLSTLSMAQLERLGEIMFEINHLSALEEWLIQADADGP